MKPSLWKKSAYHLHSVTSFTMLDLPSPQNSPEKKISQSQTAAPWKLRLHTPWLRHGFGSQGSVARTKSVNCYRY